MAEAQVQVLNATTDADLIEHERELANELNMLLRAEKSYYKQKSRVSWIREGDQNIRYFHKLVAAQKKRSSINFFMDAEGNKLTSYTQISSEAVAFF